MQPNKISGLTLHQRQRICRNKQRWSDDLAAVAGALHALEARPETGRLFIYRCPICRGWHLTRKPHPNQQPITLGETVA